MPSLGRFRAARMWGDRARRAGGDRVGVPAHDLAGTRPDGSPVEFAMEGRSGILLFLTSSCYGCRVVWEGLAHPAAGRPGRLPGTVVVVTPSATTESARAVAALAPPGSRVIMSSDAWHDYGVREAPWCVVVAGGMVAARGPARDSWAELAAGSEGG